MDMTEFRWFEYQNLARSELNSFCLITFKKNTQLNKNRIFEQTNLRLFSLVPGSINTEIMTGNEIDFWLCPGF